MEQKLQKRKIAVVAVDGLNRPIQIIDLREESVRNARHLKTIIASIEASHNESSTTLKAQRVAAIRALKVGSFKNVQVDPLAVGLNQRFVKEEEKRRLGTQDYLRKLKEKKAARNGTERELQPV